MGEGWGGWGWKPCLVYHWWNVSPIAAWNDSNVHWYGHCTRPCKNATTIQHAAFVLFLFFLLLLSLIFVLSSVNTIGIYIILYNIKYIVVYIVLYLTNHIFIYLLLYNIYIWNSSYHTPAQGVLPCFSHASLRHCRIDVVASGAISCSISILFCTRKEETRHVQLLSSIPSPPRESRLVSAKKKLSTRLSCTALWSELQRMVFRVSTWLCIWSSHWVSRYPKKGRDSSIFRVARIGSLASHLSPLPLAFFLSNFQHIQTALASSCNPLPNMPNCFHHAVNPANLCQQ